MTKQYDPPDKSKSLGKTHTLEEIGEVLGVSRQAVAEMEQRILRKLRKELFKRGIDKDNILPDN